MGNNEIKKKKEFKANQKIWHFDTNIWKPIQDTIYDMRGDMYFLTDCGDELFSESELFTSRQKCLDSNQHP